MRLRVISAKAVIGVTQNDEVWFAALMAFWSAQNVPPTSTRSVMLKYPQHLLWSCSAMRVSAETEENTAW